jgi:diguanylate cyclase (GGDEF)-like protein
MLENINKISYKCTKLFKEKQSFIDYEFFDKNLIGVLLSDGTTSDVKHIYQNILISLSNGDIEQFLKNHIGLADLYVKFEVPYIVFINEINHLKNLLIELLINCDLKDEVVDIYKLYAQIQNLIAKEYLSNYLKNLVTISNKRLSSLSDMVDQMTVVHYASHLEWLVDLSIAMQKNDLESFPQTDKTLCGFGKWLASDAKKIIKNNSKLKELERIHSQLHYVALQIKQIILSGEKSYDFDILLTYLEKSELLSLSIGTELALIDNTIVNQKATKDSLTGALGRQVLEQIFHNQYEISQATNSKFVIALCDLDHFKNINDTYGHIAGDKMLKGFVEVVKKSLRSSDIIIRYGGEEFVLILPAITHSQSLTVLEKIRDEFEKFKLNFENNKISTTVSIGMHEIEAKDRYTKDCLDNYINFADHKLYQAKNSGRNKIV